jgi:ABC-type polysaccharide/polyol phosphate transport system ATPase subunit
LSENAIKVENVSMKFNLKQQVKMSFKTRFQKLIKRELLFQEFWALQDINLQVKKGDRLGVVGLNGAGKSTLLKIIAGVMKPSKGMLDVKGRIVPLLELGAGFDPRYTGRENIFLRGAILGYEKKFIEQKFEEIVDFAEIRNFLDVPLVNYSSGMKARLGFAISTMVEPDVLILDEVLSVGDAKFRKKSYEKMMSLIESKDTTVLFVSHSINQVKNLCNKAIWMEKGKIIMDGDSEEVCAKYAESTE